MKLVVDFFKTDVIRKISALTFAILIYVGVRMQLLEEQPIRDVTIKLNVENPDIAIIGDPAIRTNLKLRGSRKALATITNNSIKATYTVPADAEPGSFQFFLSGKNFENLPSGVEVVNVDPKEFTIQLDPVVEQSLPVRVSLNRKGMPKGLAVSSAYTQPSSVTIKGPQHIVKDILELKTEDIKLVNRYTDFFQDGVSILGIPNTTISPDKVRAIVNLTQRTDNITLKDQPVRIINNSKLKIAQFLDSPTVTLTLEAQPELLDQIERNPTTMAKAFIEIPENAFAGEMQLPIRVWLAEKECRVSYMTPVKIRVKLEKEAPILP